MLTYFIDSATKISQKAIKGNSHITTGMMWCYFIFCTAIFLDAPSNLFVVSGEWVTFSVVSDMQVTYKAVIRH